MRAAITTRFMGPTNFLGSRIKATSQAGSLTVWYDHGLNSEDNHTEAAKALAAKLRWDGDWLGGGMPDGRGNCYVNVAPIDPRHPGVTFTIAREVK